VYCASDHQGNRAGSWRLECEEIGLCKEMREVWREVGIDSSRPKCNCTW
jgi:hypothetical protein